MGVIVSKQAEKVAFERGCRVIDGKIYSWTGKERKFDTSPKGYPRFGIKCGSRTDGTRRHYDVMVHRLVAYQKYGNSIYEEGIEVRHLDDNPLNFFEHNIAIGTHSDNMLDIPKEKRKKMAKHGIKYTNKEVIIIKSFHDGSYAETMDFFNITSKGTLWYILNKR